jgi:5'-nucleotidase
LVLLCNDDGYRAPGILALGSSLREWAEVVICAPEHEQSAASHALSLHRPLRLSEHGSGVFSVDGTPADCVYVALHTIGRVLPRRPDLVASGLNRGANLGLDVFYSGTVAAAREGALRGIVSLALSAAVEVDVQAAVRYSSRIARAALARGSPAPLLLNVNFPAGSDWPARATRLGNRVYGDDVWFRHDPQGKEYLWIGGPSMAHRPLSGSDTEAFDQGVVGVTPLALDLWAPHEQGRAEEVVALLAEL